MGRLLQTFLDFYLHRKDINRGLDPASYSVLFCFASTFPHVQQQREEEEGPGPKLLKNVVAAATSGGRGKIDMLSSNTLQTCEPRLTMLTQMRHQQCSVGNQLLNY